MKIDELIKQPESKTLELKRDLSSPDRVVKSVVAMANSAGGRIVIGVTDDHQVVGVSNEQTEEERIANLITDNIEPLIVPDIALTTVDRKTLIIINVPSSTQKPHHHKREGELDGTYVRLGSTNRKADIDLIKELKRVSAGIHFDEEPCKHTGIDDLDLVEIKERFARFCDGKLHGKTRIDQAKLLSSKLLVRNGDEVNASNGGIILFGKDRLSYFPDTIVQCARFRGKTKETFLDKLDIDAPPLDAVDMVEEFLKKHALNPTKLEGFKRNDSWNIPLESLREIVINAFVHQDYSTRGSRLRVAIFDDRIEVESPGLLVPSMTLNQMKSGESVVRNRVIARFFKEVGLFDQWGIGVQTVIRNIVVFGLPEPVVEESGNRIKWTVYVNIDQDKKQTNKTKIKQTKKMPVKEKVEFKMSEIIEFGKVPRSREELLEHVELFNNTQNARKYIAPLITQGKLRMTEPDKPNSKTQKYYSK